MFTPKTMVHQIDHGSPTMIDHGSPPFPVDVPFNQFCPIRSIRSTSSFLAFSIAVSSLPHNAAERDRGPAGASGQSKRTSDSELSWLQESRVPSPIIWLQLWTLDIWLFERVKDLKEFQGPRLHRSEFGLVTRTLRPEKGPSGKSGQCKA